MKHINIDLPETEDWIKPPKERAQGFARRRAYAERDSRQIRKRLSRSFGNKKSRQNQLVARLKRKRGYKSPVRGGTGKQTRTRRRKFAKKGMGHSDAWWEMYHALRAKGHDKTSAAKITNSRISKHLPGQHDQKKHGNRDGTGQTSPVESQYRVIPGNKGTSSEGMWFVVDNVTGKTESHTQTRRSAEARVKRLDKYTQFKRDAIKRVGWDPFQDDPPVQIGELIDDTMETALAEGLANWKGNPGTMSRHMGDILDGTNKPGPKSTTLHYLDRNRARAMLDAIENAPEIDYDLWRGQPELPTSMTRAGDTVPDVGDEFEFLWVGASSNKAVAIAHGDFLFEFTGEKRALDIDSKAGAGHRFSTEGEHLMSGKFRIAEIKQDRVRDLTVITVEQTDHWVGDNERIAKHLKGTPDDHDQSTHGKRGMGRTFGSLKVQEAIEIQAERKKLGKSISDMTTTDEKHMFDGWRDVKYNDKYETFGAMGRLHRMTENDDLRNLLEFEGLDIEEEHEFWKRHATRRILEISPSHVFIAESMDHVKEFLDGSEVYIRVDDHSLMEILWSDWSDALHTQDYTGDSNGMYDPENRAVVHNILFGYDEDHYDAWAIGRSGSPASYDVPLYGYVAQGPWEGGEVGQYGAWALEIDPGHKRSTTISLGDSLDDSGVARVIHSGGLTGNSPASAPSGYNDPGIEILDGLARHVRTFTGFSPSELPDALVTLGEHYVEAQIHRKVGLLDDVVAAHIQVFSDATMQDALDEYPAIYDIVTGTGLPVKVWAGRELLGTYSGIDWETDELVIE